MECRGFPKGVERSQGSMGIPGDSHGHRLGHVERSENSHQALGTGEYPSTRPSGSGSGDGTGQGPLMAKDLHRSDLQRRSTDQSSAERRRMLAGISSNNFDKRKTNLGLVGRLMSATLGLAERKRSTVAEEVVAAVKDDDSEDMEVGWQACAVWSDEAFVPADAI